MMYRLRGFSLIILFYIMFCMGGCSGIENDLKIEYNDVFTPDISIKQEDIKSHLNLIPKIDLPLYADTIADTIFVFEVYETVVSQSWIIMNFTEPDDSINLWLSNYDCVSITEIDSLNRVY